MTEELDFLPRVLVKLGVHELIGTELKHFISWGIFTVLNLRYSSDLDNLSSYLWH